MLPGDRVGLVAFAGTAFVQSPLTLDYGVFLQSLDALDAGIIPRGGTALAAAIDAALAALEGRESKHQAVVLITDGESHEGDVAAAAKRAAERGVKLFTVGIGTTEGELIPGEGGAFLKDRRGNVVKSRLDEQTLQDIAAESGGVYVHAERPEVALVDLYRDHIAAMEKRELGSTLERRWEQRFQWPLGLALALLLLELLIADRAAVRRAGGRS
jgi:Ca-activated chloride channel family protein